jgi:cytochrome c biogenesis protein CcdA
MLNRLVKRFSPVVVRTLDITEPEAQELNEALCCVYGVPEERRLIAPSLFGGGRYLIEHDVDDDSAEEMFVGLASAGNVPPWDEVAGFREQARESIVARFRSLGPLTVVLGGLVDGVNPCAFATIIFFVSYLAFVGRAGREILWIGFAFTTAVFLTYLLVGLGAMTFLQSLSVFRMLSLIVYGITAVLAIGLGILSVVDFWKLRQGKTKEVALQLPGFLKKRIHKTIRERARTRNYVFAAFITGAIVSLLELACTGQVYLPTICFVTGIPELRAHALAYLILYNLMFVVPLVAVFLVSYYGATSDQLARFFQSHAAAVKLCTAIFFFALAAILISVLL